MKKHSVILSTVFVFVFAAVLLALVIMAPLLAELYSELRGLSDTVRVSILTAFYLCAVPGFGALFSLWRLLEHIRKEQVFIRENCRHLGIVSWCCLAVSVITMAASFFYLPMILISVAMLFIFFILRVVRNCMIAGTELKEENSLTI